MLSDLYTWKSHKYHLAVLEADEIWTFKPNKPPDMNTSGFFDHHKYITPLWRVQAAILAPVIKLFLPYF